MLLANREGDREESQKAWDCHFLISHSLFEDRGREEGGVLAHGGPQRTTSRSLFLPSTMQGPGFELRLSGSLASTLVCWAVSLARKLTFVGYWVVDHRKALSCFRSSYQPVLPCLFTTFIWATRWCVKRKKSYTSILLSSGHHLWSLIPSYSNRAIQKTHRERLKDLLKDGSGIPTEAGCTHYPMYNSEGHKTC